MTLMFAGFMLLITQDRPALSGTKQPKKKNLYISIFCEYHLFWGFFVRPPSTVYEHSVVKDFSKNTHMRDLEHKFCAIVLISNYIYTRISLYRMNTNE